jgi:FkbH-like protein
MRSTLVWIPLSSSTTTRPNASAFATRCHRLAFPELPEDPSDWPAVFQAAGYFEQSGFSKEDGLRAGFYKANALRAAQMERIGDHDDYLRSLSMTLSIAPFDSAGRTRIVQLISKSNQFNLTTRRYSDAEIAALQSRSDVFTIQARLEDIFGDNGMISAVICRQSGHAWEVDTWIMSCRVLGRRVEETLLQYIVEQARLKGITEISGRYIPTAKNGLVRDHFARLGFAEAGSQNGETSWRLAVDNYRDKALPLKVDVQREAGNVSASAHGRD